jgi:hypothetical protein
VEENREKKRTVRRETLREKNTLNHGIACGAAVGGNTKLPSEESLPTIKTNAETRRAAGGGLTQCCKALKGRRKKDRKRDQKKGHDAPGSA